MVCFSVCVGGQVDCSRVCREGREMKSLGLGLEPQGIGAGCILFLFLGGGDWWGF